MPRAEAPVTHRWRARPSVALHTLAWLMAFATAAASAGWSLPGIDDLEELHPELAHALHLAADAARAAHGLAPTAWDEGLARAARSHAAELAARGLLDHASPTPGRHTVADRLARAGVPYATHGENLAYVPAGLDPAHSAVEGWLRSPPHRANLLAPSFDRAGYGTATDASGGVFVVQLLATVPWAPHAWSAEVAQVTATRLTLGLRVQRPTTAWIEVDGRGERVSLAAGGQRWHTEVEDRGPWEVRVGVLTRQPNGFTLDEAGAVATSGRWRPAEAPRASLRVTGSEAGRVPRAVVRLRLEADAPGLALLVDGVHRPEAVDAPGHVTLDLALADGGVARLALAEATGGGRLVVRHAWLLHREGDVVHWEARP